MGKSCLTCTDPWCVWHGVDRGACEEHDAIPHPEEYDPMENLIAGLRSDVDDLSAQVKSLQGQIDDFFAAVMRLREGEE